MILRRITKHLETQNWFAVVLDLLIVVLGVFLGIQIGNWNEDRLDEVAYQKAHSRMISETKSNIRYAENLLNLASPVVEKFTRATNDLRECRDDEQAEARISDAIKLLSGTFAFQFDNEAITELTTSQRLLERQSSARIELYSLYARKLDASITYSEKVLDKMELRSDELHPFIDYGEFAESPMSDRSLSRTLVLAVDISEACKNRAFRRMFYIWESGHLYQIDLIEKFIEDSQAYLASLGVSSHDGEGE